MLVLPSGVTSMSPVYYWVSRDSKQFFVVVHFYCCWKSGTILHSLLLKAVKLICPFYYRESCYLFAQIITKSAVTLNNFIFLLLLKEWHKFAQFTLKVVKLICPAYYWNSCYLLAQFITESRETNLPSLLLRVLIPVCQAYFCDSWHRFDKFITETTQAYLLKVLILFCPH